MFCSLLEQSGGPWALEEDSKTLSSEHLQQPKAFATHANLFLNGQGIPRPI